MGHIVFIIMHVLALMFGAVLLWLTVPLHLIYAAVNGRTDKTPVVVSADDGTRPTPTTHVKCPDCAELVRKEARVCKHCSCRLIPQP